MTDHNHPESSKNFDDLGPGYDNLGDPVVAGIGGPAEHLDSGSVSTIDLEADAFLGGKSLQLNRNKGKRLGVLFWVAVAVFSIIAIVAILAPYLPLQDPNGTIPSPPPDMGPSWSHWLGTDNGGNDLFSRVIWGARTSLEIGFGTMALAVPIAVPLALVAAYRGRKIDLIMTTSLTIILAFPAIVAVLAILAFWQPITTWRIILVLAFFSIPLIYRLTRASTLAYTTREFVTAAKALGASDTRILLREVLPNVAPAILSLALLGVSTVIVVEGTLSFLGYSVPPPAVSLGQMINAGKSYLATDFGMTFWPTLMIVTILLTIIFIGDKLFEYFETSASRL